MNNECLVQQLSYEFNVTFVNEGVEKHVFKIFEDGMPYALKIFKNVRPGNQNVDTKEEARKEFEAHIELRKTPLKNLIPAPIRLFNTRDGNVSGLVVEWRDGMPLESSDKLLTSGQVFDLEEKLLSSLSLGIVPNDDMYSEGNIMLGENELWIAECRILTLNEGIESLYRHRIVNGMNYLRRHFVEVGSS